MEGTTSHRILSLDVLRGIALLGLPLMNIIHFSMPVAAYINPYAYAESDFLHHEIFIFLSIFADQKFMGLFTMLFGAGLILLYQKNKIEDGKPARRHYSRMFFLLLLGFLHYWYLWSGDILMFYAVLGMCLYPLLSLKPKILYGLFALFFIAAMNTAYIEDVNEESLGLAHYQSIENYYQPSQAQIAETKSLLLGSYEEVMVVNRQKQNNNEEEAFESSSEEENAAAMILFSSLFFYIVLKMIAMIILGMALFKSGVLQGDLSLRSLKTIGVGALILGCIVTVFSLVSNYANGWNMQFYFEFGFLLKELGSVPMAIAFACIGVWLVKTGKMLLSGVLLANVGKMALTNYLMQSLICFLLFYGPGLGLHGSVSRRELILIVVGIWIFQIVFSNIWMKHFLQGPIEWCWRTCSAFQLQPLRRNA